MTETPITIAALFVGKNEVDEELLGWLKDGYAFG